MFYHYLHQTPCNITKNLAKNAFSTELLVREWNELPPSSYDELQHLSITLSIYYWMHVSTLLSFQS